MLPYARWLVCSLACATVLVSSPVRADDVQKARALFKEGTTYFDLGQFDKAIEAWQAGYREKPDPGFLFNIGQAYRLAGNPQKAIFFYKGYLRHSPKAANRAEVEQKILTLQKQIDQQAASKTAPSPAPAPPSGAAPPAAPAPTVSPSPPPAPTPGAGPGAPAGEPGPTPPPNGSAASPPSGPAVSAPPAEEPPGATLSAQQPAPRRRFDVMLGAGLNTWLAGDGGKAPAAFASAVGAGYTFGSGLRRAELRLGIQIEHTFLHEGGRRDDLWSALVVPTGRLFIVPRRLAVVAQLGVGAFIATGLPTDSVLFKSRIRTVTGPLTVFLVRPALGLELELKRGVGLWASAGLAYSPFRSDAQIGPLVRVEILGGPAVRF